MKALTRVVVILAAAQSAQAADLDAGKRIVGAVCAACHGETGVSVSDNIPNLAGQRAATSRRSLSFSRMGLAKNLARSVERPS